MASLIKNYDINILVPNYNNAKYLAECLQSIINQKTRYSYFVIIVDDKSTDDSVNIITKFCNDFPNKIDFIQNKKNCGTCETTLNLYKQINSKYFTVLDSDDYWIDDNFLERSVNFLQNNNEYTSYSNNQQLYYEDNVAKNSIYHTLTHKSFGFDIKNNVFLGFCRSHTSACMFRNIFSKKMISIMEIAINNKNENDNFINQLYCQIYEGDTFRNIISNTHGQAYQDDTIVSSVYRIRQQNSRWSSLSLLIQNIINYFIFIANYSNVTHCKLAQNYLIAHYIEKIDCNLLKKVIEYNNNINNNILYNKKIVTINEINNIILHNINIYNLLPTNRFNKHYLFCFPSKIIGGYETLFVNLAVELQKIGYKVSYIDYENGHFNKLNKNNNNINLIKFPDNHPYNDSLINSNFTITHVDDVNLIMPLTISSELAINLSKNSKIMYYMAHPKSVEFLMYRSKVSMSQIVNHINSISKNICCQDEINLINIQKITNKPHKIVPICVKEPEFTFTKIKSKNNDEINIGYLGRIDIDKVYSLINILDNFVLYKTTLKKNIHIICDYNNENLSLINVKYYKTCGINIIFTGLLINENKFNYLYNNIDIYFGLGTTVLEAASIKIPSVLILLQSHRNFNDNKFILLYNLANINNGFYEEDIINISKISNLKFNKFSEILDNIYYNIINKESKIEEIGNKCYDYFINKHSLNNTLLKVTEYFMITT